MRLHIKNTWKNLLRILCKSNSCKLLCKIFKDFLLVASTKLIFSMSSNLSELNIGTNDWQKSFDLCSLKADQLSNNNNIQTNKFQFKYAVIRIWTCSQNIILYSQGISFAFIREILKKNLFPLTDRKQYFSKPFWAYYLQNVCFVR